MKLELILLLMLACYGPQANGQEKVYICVSPTAHAYHSGYCTGLNACTHRVDQMTLKEAKHIGKDPCDFCYGKSSHQLPVKAPAAGQCSAITKKGTRCSRLSRSGGYCWQHGG